MTGDPVIRLLHERLGLDPASVGERALRAALHTRMAALGIATADAYAARLAQDPVEFLALTDAVVVPESWFFRNPPLFAALAREVAGRVQGRSDGAPVRILSAPCGAGQEPYSVAMALLDAGLAPATWSVEALDVSPNHLAQASRGIYGALAFRDIAPELRQRYFDSVPDGWQLRATVRNLVHFRQGNLLDPHALPATPTFAVILCRNLLIYLHDEARRQVVETLTRALRPGGVIATGTAEALPAIDPQFVSVDPDLPFLFRRAEPARQLSPVLVPPTRQVLLPSPPLRGRGVGGEGKARGQAPSPPTPRPRSGGEGSKAADTVPDLLTRARQLADRGELGPAVQACREHLDRAGPSAAAYSLLGVLRQAAHDNDDAARCFQRALYLDPNHAEALEHLAVLAQARGDRDQAARLLGRLARARQEDAP
jgi:chemotaxis protein methyltransferase WspC